MPSPLTLAIAAMLLFGLADAVSRRARQMHAPVSTYMFVQCPFFTVSAVVASVLWTGHNFSLPAWGFASLAGVLGFAAMALLLKSLKLGEASVNVVVYRLNFVLTAGLSLWIFKEKITPAKIVGLTLAAAAIGVFFLGVRVRGTHALQAMGYAVAGMVANAAMQLTWAWATKAGVPPPSFLIVQSLVFMVLTTAFAWSTQGMRVSKVVLVHAPINGVLMATATLAVLASMVQGEASVSLPISQLSFVVTAALAIAFLREPLTAAKLFGGVLAVAAVVLLGW